MPKRFSGALLLALCLLPGCRQQQSADGPPVEASAYDAFYLWPGVRPAETLHPRTLYLLDGEVRRGGAARMERLRMGTPHLPDQAVWLVVRADRLDWNEATRDAIFADLETWRKAGNGVVGLQVDFDAATKGISGYAAFLSDLRHRLPKAYRLSVTGLMDWSAHGDPQTLTSLAGTVDEVVVQTYQGRSTIPGYETYFRRMEHFPIPFRVALVEHGAWQAPPALKHHPRFRGYVVFLFKPSGR
ncbi:DUF3142 domain-containing protein [Novosphingobium terrae]|uniref:DUF3142 domain-containing protein n=1 Tax=Novosphingobium terrae TaxID=2726189 RepID=UPI00197D6D70|nr:DUF3142 domain-containing protein [Novosphingobium terrae]